MGSLKYACQPPWIGCHTIKCSQFNLTIQESLLKCVWLPCQVSSIYWLYSFAFRILYTPFSRDAITAYQSFLTFRRFVLLQLYNVMQIYCVCIFKCWWLHKCKKVKEDICKEKKDNIYEQNMVIIYAAMAALFLAAREHFSRARWDMRLFSVALRASW